MTGELRLHRSVPDRDDLWRVECDGVTIGSIIVPGGRPGETVWQWSITVQDPSALIRKNGMADSREDAMAQFRRAWDIYRPEIGDGRWAWHVRHMAEVDARAAISRERKAPERG